jgi:hypothetical protein
MLNCGVFLTSDDASTLLLITNPKKLFADKRAALADERPAVLMCNSTELDLD